MTNPYSSPDYKRNREALRHRVAVTGTPCVRCQQPIDLSATWPNPQSFSADHIDALGVGGDVAGELAPMHLGCNSAAGGSLGQQKRRAKRRRYSFHEDDPGRR